MTDSPLLSGIQKTESDVTGPGTTQYAQGKGIHKAQMFGLYRGVVEYNRDPEQRGRVMIRVLEDGPEMQIDDPGKPRVATGDLGWAEPCFGMAGGQQYGAFSVPTIGSRVFVLYGRGDRQNPIYFGGWSANSHKQRRYGATKTILQPPLDRDGNPRYPARPAPYWDNWQEEQGNESPMETCEMVDDQPDVHLLFKSLKGASFLWKERDYDESLVITDRQGAELRFDSPNVSKDSGMYRRGRNSATRHKAIKRDNLEFSHVTHLVDAQRQGLEMESTPYEASVDLQAHPVSDVEKNPELMPTRLALELDEGRERISILYIENHEVVGKIEVDAVARRINIEGIDEMRLVSNTNLWIESPTVRITGNLEVHGEILQSGDQKLSFIDNNVEPFDGNIRNFRMNDDHERWPEINESFNHRVDGEWPTMGRR